MIFIFGFSSQRPTHSTVVSAVGLVYRSLYSMNLYNQTIHQLRRFIGYTNQLQQNLINVIYFVGIDSVHCLVYNIGSNFVLYGFLSK